VRGKVGEKAEKWGRWDLGGVERGRVGGRKPILCHLGYH